MQNSLTFLGRFLLFILAFGVAIVSMRYWSFENIDILSLKTPEVLANQLFRAAFYGHVIFGPIAMMTGPIQFLPKFRARYPSVHRLLGKIYVSACLLSGLSGLVAAQWALGGPFNQLGFSLLAIAWLFTTSQAYLTIRKKEVDAHQRWMLRSYALTLAAVTLRIYQPILQGPMGMTFIEAYQIVAWLCWVPNLLIVELLMKRLTRVDRILVKA